MKKFFTSAVLLAAALFTANAQQLQTGDQFTYTNAEGVEKTYIVTGENLIENPSFDNNTTGWVGGAGGALTGVEWNNSGGVDGGAYLRLTENAGKGGNGSIGTAWALEKGKTYVFSYFIRQNTETTAVAKEGYIVTSETNTPRGDETKTLMFGYEDADCAWTQNIVVTTAEYDYLQFCARWLGGRLCFDAFILAEISEVADPAELEQLLANCQEWMGVYDEPKEQEALQAVVDKAQNMLDNFDTYTSDEINAMVHELKEALLDYRVVNASDEYPVDVTARYLKNPNFENGLTDWTRNNDAVGGGSNIRVFEYFGESSRILEINGQPGVDTHVSQTVYNLPMGYYRFTVQCVMNHSVDTSDPEAKSGAAIYCNGSELDMVTREITTDGAAKDASYPETFTIEGIVSADSITVGFVGYTGTNFTYVAIDNVKLEYAGFDAGIYIDQLVSNVLDWIGDNSDYLLPAIALALEEETAIAEDALSGTEEEMNAAYKQLDAAFAKAKESITLMKQLDEAYQEFAIFVAETMYDGADAANAIIEEVEAFLGMEDEEASYDELDAMIAKLQQAQNDYRLSQKATKEEPADYTFFINNPNFEAQGNWVWTVTQSGGGTDLWVGGCRPAMDGGENRQGVNLWGNHLTSLDLHQELTGLPNGLYGISAELITQAGYATDQHLYIKGVNSAVSANLAVEGWDNFEWTTLTTPYVVVIDGTLTIGAETNTFGEASEGWFQATNFKLQYYGPASDEDLKVAYEATLAEAQAIVATLLKGDAAALQAKIDEAIALSATSYAEAAALLAEPIAAAKAAAKALDTYNNGAKQTAIDNLEVLTEQDALDILNAAITFAEGITAADTTTSAALAAITEKLNAYIDYTTYLNEVIIMADDRKAGYADANVKAVKATIAAQKADLLVKFRSKASVEDLKAKLANEVFFLEKSVFMGAQAGDDLTSVIMNPNFDTNADGWIIRQGNGNGPTITGEHYTGVSDNRYMDSWNGTTGALSFAAMQVLTEIPNGTYTLKFIGRTSGDNVYAFAMGEAITDTLVNDSTILKQVSASEATKWAMIPNHGAIHGGLYDADSIAFLEGTIIEATEIMNANGGHGFGWSEIVIDDIEVKNHEMVIGVTPDSLVHKQAGFTGTWFSADEWTLTLKTLGDNSNWVIDSAIENVDAVATKAEYYTIDGRQVALPGKGINIVKTVYSDGRIEVKKVFVK